MTLKLSKHNSYLVYKKIKVRGIYIDKENTYLDYIQFYDSDGKRHTIDVRFCSVEIKP